MTATATWGLWLLWLAGGLRAAHAGPLRKTGKMEDGTAAKEDVNVLMFGVIQLSESLKYVYETTEANIEKISQTLRSHEGTVLKLERETEQAVRAERQVKEVMQFLQAQMARQQAQMTMAKDWLGRKEQEEVELETKVKNLELYLNANTSVKELQEQAKEQSDVLNDLRHFVEFQKENIETQNEKLSKLQKMSEDMT